VSAQDRQPNVSAVDEARELLTSSDDHLRAASPHHTTNAERAQVLALQAIAASLIALHEQRAAS
jgi:hypothetical protein